MSDDGKVAAVGGEKDIFSRLAIFSKPVGGAIQAFRAIARWRSDVMARRELDGFIRSALEILPQRTAAPEDARAVLMAEGIITADGELAAEYRPARDSAKELAAAPSKHAMPPSRGGLLPVQAEAGGVWATDAKDNAGAWSG